MHGCRSSGTMAIGSCTNMTCSGGGGTPDKRTGISDYKQSLQFQNLNGEKHNIQMEVGLVQFINSPHLKFIPSIHVYNLEQGEAAKMANSSNPDGNGETRS